MLHKLKSRPQRVALGIVFTVAAVSMTFWIVRARYEDGLRHQIWPSFVPEISVVSSSDNAGDPTLLLLGDSRMAQWGLPELKHWRLVNAGAGGLTTGQVLLAAPGLLEKYHPDVVALEVGINDLKFLGLRPAMFSTIVPLAAKNVAAITAECVKRHCRLIVLETWPPSRPDWARRLVWSAAIPASVNELNAELRKMNAPGQGIRVVDLFNSANLKPSPMLYRDTMHLTQEAYHQLTPALENVLKDINPSPAK